MHLVIAPDSFKGSLSAKEVATTIWQAAKNEWPELRCTLVPMADGGEGTVETLVSATQGQFVKARITGPMGNHVDSFYGILGNRKTVALEVASVAGLPMVPLANRTPLHMTTFGLGELLKKSLDDGFREFIIGLGGSATNDGGLGFLQALGAIFTDQNGLSVLPTGLGLGQIRQVDLSNLDPRLKKCTFQIASDVQNTLCGPLGASAVFGPQKGATPQDVSFLDQSLFRYAKLIEQEVNQSFHDIPGTGAAGGLGFALMMLGAKMHSGASLIGDVVHLENTIAHSDFVITGEGQSDAQTLHGKLPMYVSAIAAKHKVPAILLSGSLGEGYESLFNSFISIQSIIARPMPLESAMKEAKHLLYQASFNLIRMLRHITYQ